MMDQFYLFYFLYFILFYLFILPCMLCMWWSMKSECLVLDSAERGIKARSRQRGENCSFSKRDLAWGIKEGRKDIKRLLLLGV